MGGGSDEAVGSCSGECLLVQEAEGRETYIGERCCLLGFVKIC